MIDVYCMCGEVMRKESVVIEDAETTRTFLCGNCGRGVTVIEK